ncbi:LysR family transcriptional regulator [Stenotrophomonas sp.]|uniref:LysR family transcriptional regulator n=1 Tax=Stenotrophomonas sp. TaxID=69392 RepID=UPI0028AC1D58|nr:LysR family transcriptional regulator [Stenotrophomonas sp.]
MFDKRQSDEWQAFLAIVKSGTIAGAGDALQRHPSVISKRLQSLEGRLSVRLVERTTRRLQLTEAGRALADRLLQASSLLEEAESEASAGSKRATGTLRLALPGAMGRMWLGRLVAQFAAENPTLTIDANYSDDFRDLVEEQYDLAIRIGTLPDSRLVAKRLCSNRRGLFASPDYISRNGELRHPSELAQHRLLSFTGLHSFPDLLLSSGRNKIKIHCNSTFISNDSQALVDAADMGVGIIAVGEWLVVDRVRQGRLIPVLPEWDVDSSSGVYIVRPSTKHAPAKTMAFKRWIEGYFAEGPPWERAREALPAIHDGL